MKFNIWNAVWLTGCSVLSLYFSLRGLIKRKNFRNSPLEFPKLLAVKEKLACFYFKKIVAKNQVDFHLDIYFKILSTYLHEEKNNMLSEGALKILWQFCLLSAILVFIW